MCQSCRATIRRRSELEELDRRVEQALSWLGLVRPGRGRAQGGAPRELVDGLVVDLDRLWEELARDIEGTLREGGGKTVVDQGALQSLLIGFQSRLEGIWTAAVAEAVAAGVAHAGNQLGAEVTFSAVDPSLLSSLQSQAVTLCEATAAKIRGDVQAALIESVRLGENLTQTIARLQSISSLTAYDAERIARTELARAANAGRLQGYQGRLTHVTWVLGPTYKGGCACGEMAGTYTLEEASGLSIPLHPNCDCLWRPATEEEVAGYEAAA